MARFALVGFTCLVFGGTLWMTHGLQSDDACPHPDLRTQDYANRALHGSCDLGDSSVLLQKKVVSTAMSSQLASTNASFDKFACMGRLNHFYDVGKQAAKFRKVVGNDPLFPMDITSIDPSLPNNHHSNSWQSFQQVAGVPDESSVPVIGPSGPDWHDIEQGSLGNCYFLAALASLAQHQPQFIENMFVDRHLWGKNIYKTKWYINGAETIVAVDNMIPTTNGSPRFGKLSLTGEFWPIIVEKAWAKIHTNYQAIHGGFGAVEISRWTRAPYHVLYHHHDGVTRQMVWDRLWNASQQSFPMLTCTKAQAAQIGLPTGHEYAILDVAMRDGATVCQGSMCGVPSIRVYNPWRSEYYTGPTPNIDDDDGAFWVTLDEIFDYFLQTSYVEVHNDYQTSAMDLPADGIMRVYSLEVTTASPSQPVSVMATWPDFRTVQPTCFAHNQKLDLQFALVSNSTEPQVAPVRHNPWFNASLRITEPGTYSILVRAQFPQSKPSAERLFVHWYSPEHLEFESSPTGARKVAKAIFGEDGILDSWKFPSKPCGGLSRDDCLSHNTCQWLGITEQGLGCLVKGKKSKTCPLMDYYSKSKPNFKAMKDALCPKKNVDE